MDRRQFLSSVTVTSTIGIAGCRGDQFGEAENVFEEKQSTYQFDAIGTIPKEKYATLSFESPGIGVEFTYSIETRNGDRMDVWVVDPDELEEYEQKNAFDYYPDFSETEFQSYDISEPIKGGQHVFIFDNSSLSDAGSSDPLVFDLLIP